MLGADMIPPVSLVNVENEGIEQAVFRAIEAAGGLSRRLRPDTKVLVKPNLCGPHPSGTGVVTDSRVTEAVTKYVLECGTSAVVIGEGAGAGYDFGGAQSTEECFRVSGTADAAARLGVALVNLNADESVDVPVPGGYVMKQVKIARTAYESDLIISVPVMKTHKRTVATLSLKNMKGVMPGDEKRKTHRLGLDRGIADLVSVMTPGYVVIDGNVGIGGSWEYPEDSVDLGLILAGADPLAADTTGIRVMGLSVSRVAHLQLFAEKMGRSLSEEFAVVGEKVHGRPRFRDGFEVFQERYPEVAIIEGRSTCSGCSGEAIGALSHIRMAGCSDSLRGVTIVMGCPISAAQKRQLPETPVLYMGKCCRDRVPPRGTSKTDGSSVFTQGCPPTDGAIIRALADLCGFDGPSVVAHRDGERERLWARTRKFLKA